MWDEAADEFRYLDTGELVPRDPVTSIATDVRPCPSCGEPPTAEGYDACLGFLPGVTDACCGHGIPEEAYQNSERWPQTLTVSAASGDYWWEAAQARQSRTVTEPPTPADIDRWWRKAQDRQARLDAAIRAERDPEPVDMAATT